MASYLESWANILLEKVPRDANASISVFLVNALFFGRDRSNRDGRMKAATCGVRERWDSRWSLS